MSDTKPKPKTKTGLSAALLQAQKDMPALKKDATGPHGYKYTSSETMVEGCKCALNNAGLLVRPLGHELKHRHLMDNGAAEPFLCLCRTFRVEHPDSGEFIDIPTEYPVLSNRGMPLDKAVSAAMTTSQAYFLRDLCQVPRFDAEVDRRTPQEETPPPPQRTVAAPDDHPPTTPPPDEVNPVPPSSVKQDAINAMMQWTGRKKPHTVQPFLKGAFRQLNIPEPENGGKYTEDQWAQVLELAQDCLDADVNYADRCPVE